MAAPGETRGRACSSEEFWRSSAPGAHVWLLWKWAASDFGPFDQIRSVIVFSLLFFLGVQVIFSSFFISMLGISRGTYIGDYDGENY